MNISSRLLVIAALFVAAAILIGATFTAILGKAWGLFATLTVSALLALLLISTLVSHFVLPCNGSNKRKEMIDDQRD